MKTATLLFYPGNLSTIYDSASASLVPYSYINGAIDVLRRFEKIVIASPQTDLEEDRTFQVLTALKRDAPNIKVYGYTEKRSDEALIIWSLQEISWHDRYGSLIDGIYIANFDAIDVAPDGVSEGAWTRADQNLAVLGCHTHGYAVLAESLYPELTLGGVTSDEDDVTIGTTDIGTHETIQDGIVLLNYTSELSLESRDRSERIGAALFMRDYAAKEGINLFTAVYHHNPLNAPDPFPSSETFVPLDKWFTISEEAQAYGIDHFGVYTTLLGDTDFRWFYTNLNRSFTFDPRANSGADPKFNYARVYGSVQPNVYGEEATPIVLRYERSETAVIADESYLNHKGEVEIIPDLYGYWETLLAAAASPGTSYVLRLSLAETRYRDIKKTKTMIAGNSYEF